MQQYLSAALGDLADGPSASGVRTRSAAHPMATNATPDFTPKQGQYLAFIYYYTKIIGQAPAEADFQRYFRVSPPSVHNMIVTLADHYPCHMPATRLLLGTEVAGAME